MMRKVENRLLLYVRLPHGVTCLAVEKLDDRLPLVVARSSTRSRQESHGLSPQGHASEAVRHVRAGIYVDPVGQHFGLFCRSVTMHDDLAEIGATVEERRTNPQEIVCALALQRNTGTDPGMTEEILPHRQRRSQGIYELQVCLRHSRLECFRRLL